MSTRIAFLAAVMLAVLMQATSAQTFAPTADAYVRDGSNAAKNFGKATTMQVGTSTKAGNNYDSYITFNLASAPAFAQARLRLFAGLSASGSVTATVYGVPIVSWSESKITWNNKPSPGVVAGAGTVKSKTAAWLDVDVTSYLLSERGQGRGGVSFALHTAATTTPILKANTKDASTNRPQLVLLPDKAPSISLTAPQTNSVFAAPANVAVSAAVADPDGTIAKVEFFEGGTLIGTQIGPPYSVVWTKAPPGSYMLSAKATDNSGVSTISSPVSITVDALPTVTLDSPLDGTHYGTSAAFNLSATAADIDGTIARVDFYQGAKLVGSATQPP